MRKLMFYSYKGGAGRTVACANVAAALAKLGQRVIVIDLDFEAPGLHWVFGIDRMPQFGRNRGIQEYLVGDINLDDLKQVDVDLFAAGAPLHPVYTLPRGASLHYIMASPKFVQVDAQDPQTTARLQELADALSKDFDFLILDSASGIRDAFSIASDVAKEMFIFFRWSSQHVQGAIRMVEYMKKLKRLFPEKALQFYLVASATPAEEEIRSVPDPGLRGILLTLRRQAQDRIERALLDAKADHPMILHDIPEMIDLKWKEDVTVFTPEVISPYETLAGKILQMDPAKIVHA